jgi:tyrosinase
MLTGQPVAVRLVAPRGSRAALVQAVKQGGRTPISLRVEDIEAERNPNVVYGVFLDLPDDPQTDRRRYHVGNIALFGIELHNDPDVVHDNDVTGFRHVFDATECVMRLAEEGRWSESRIVVTIDLLLPEVPPGLEAELADGIVEQFRFAEETPVRIGRVSLFVG